MVGQLLLALSILVILHECGHFFPAKWFGTRVEKFYLFFDAWFSLASKKIGDTEYGIGWLPLGGYVKIAGMIDESMDKEQMKLPPQPWEFRSKKAWQRLIIMIGGVVVNFVLGFFLFGMVLWVWGRDYLPTSEAKFGMHMDSVMLNNGFRHGDQILAIGDLKLEKVEPGSFLKEILLKNARSATVQRGGETVNVTLSEDFVGQVQKNSGGKMRQFFTPRYPFEIDSIAKDGPAYASGLKDGDRIIAINEVPTPYFQDFGQVAQNFKSQMVKISALRGEKDTVKIDLRLTDAGKIGIFSAMPDKFFKMGHDSYSFAEAMPRGFKDGTGFLGDQLSAFGQMFKGKVKAKENLGSLISIGKMYGPVWDWKHFWTMTASLSLILAFMNLLPIPALDGGYVIFLLWEVVTGRRVSDSFMEKAVTVGFFLMLGLMVVALGLDIMRLF